MRARSTAPRRSRSLGLTLGFLLWQVGFMTIGGEWFGMWQSKQWNGVPSAFRFVMVIMAVLIFVALPDQELDRARHRSERVDHALSVTHPLSARR